MSYARKRQLLFAVLGAAIIAAWAPLRAAIASDGALFSIFFVFIIGGAWLVERLLGKPPHEETDD